MFKQAQSQNDPFDDDSDNRYSNTLPLSGITLPDLKDVDVCMLQKKC